MNKKLITIITILIFLMTFGVVYATDPTIEVRTPVDWVYDGETVQLTTFKLDGGTDTGITGAELANLSYSIVKSYDHNGDEVSSGIATIDTNGELTFALTGAVDVEAIYDDSGVDRTHTLRVDAKFDRIEIEGSLTHSSTPVQLSINGICLDTSNAEVNISDDIAWSVSDETAAYISDTGMLTFIKDPSRFTIYASYRGETTNSVVDNLPTYRIDGDFNGDNESILFAMNGSDIYDINYITWESDDTSIATVDKNGVMRLEGNSGEVTITAKIVKPSESARTIERTYNIDKQSAIVGTEIGGIESVSSTNTLTLDVDYLNGSGDDITTEQIQWGIGSASDNNIANIIDTNKLIFTGNEGKVEVRAVYKGVITTKKIIIDSGDIEEISINSTYFVSTDTETPVLEIEKQEGSTSTDITTSATVTTFGSSVLTVDSNNVLQYHANGDAHGTVEYGGFNFEFKVRVNKGSSPSDKFSVSATDIDVTVIGENPVLTVTKLSDNSDITTSVTMHTSDSDIVDIGTDNVLEYKKNGIAIVTVTYDGQTTAVNVDINRKTSGNYTVSDMSISANEDDSPVLTLIRPSDGTNVTTGANMESSNTNVVEIGANNILVYKNNGSAMVTVTHDGEIFRVSVTVNKDTTVPPEGVTLEEIKIVDDLDYSEDDVDLRVKAYYSDDSTEYVTTHCSWYSNDTDIAKVDDDGEVKFSGETGWVTIKARYKGLQDTVSTKVTSDDVNNYDDKKKNDKPEEEEVALKVIKYNDYSNNYTGNIVGNSSYLNSDIKDIEIVGDLDPSIGINALKVRVKYNNHESRIIDSKDVVYASSNTHVANIVDNRVVFSGASGDVTIGAQYGGFVARKSTTVKYGDVNSNPYSYDGNDYNAYVANPNAQNNNVVKVIDSISVNGVLDPSLINNIFTVTIHYKNSNTTDILGPTEVKWSTSNSKVAKILDGGIISFTSKKGKVTITANYNGYTTKLYYNVR